MTLTFSKDQVYCVLDYETYSEADLKKVGPYEYSLHPSTEIICASWVVGTRDTLPYAPIRSWADTLDGSDDWLELFEALQNNNTILVAHNALFEQVITKHVLSAYALNYGFGKLYTPPPQRWLCTASLAAAMSLPRNLENAARVLKLNTQKDMAGNRLIQKWCKPKKPSMKDPSTRHTDIIELLRLMEYCETDVRSETELLLKARPLTTKERAVWLIDQEINLYGYEVDRHLVTTALDLIEQETGFMTARIHEITDGEIRTANQRNKILEFLSSEGIDLENLQAKTVDDALLTAPPGRGRELLEVRQAMGKTSTTKYKAFEARSRSDSRVRDNLMYHGASTGRWSGTGVQPQNFPRGSIKDTYAAAEAIKDGDLELIRMVYNSPMDVFSSCLRSAIVAPEGRILDVADYSAIEARVLFWVANHEDGIKAFRDGRKMYEELAANIFSIPLSDVTPEHRFVGKQATLGCGYQMGWSKFQQTCASFGQTVSDQLAEVAVETYRDTHWPVVELWSMLEQAAVYAVENPTKTVISNHTRWYMREEFLYCGLPSGRAIAYPYAKVVYEEHKWRGKRPILRYWETNSYTKKWEETATYGGKLTENVVQAISRDLMAEAMIRIRRTGRWDIVLTVHDELVAERKNITNGTNKEFCDLMVQVPKWATNCPIKVEGWEGKRYRK